jgi:hypothetical protein
VLSANSFLFLSFLFSRSILLWYVWAITRAKPDMKPFYVYSLKKGFKHYCGSQYVTGIRFKNQNKNFESGF